FSTTSANQSNSDGLIIDAASNSLSARASYHPTERWKARVARTAFELNGDAAWWRRAASRLATVGRSGLRAREKALTHALAPCAEAWLEQCVQTAVAAR